jgi:hypothetical protein
MTDTGWYDFAAASVLLVYLGRQGMPYNDVAPLRYFISHLSLEGGDHGFEEWEQQLVTGVPIVLVPSVGIDSRNGSGGHICASAGIPTIISTAGVAIVSMLGRFK